MDWRINNQVGIPYWDNSMPIKDPVVEAQVNRLQRMRTERSSFERDWRDIKDLVRPVSVQINAGTGQYGVQYNTVRNENVYDGTAMDALEELACALHSYLTNPAERWFEVQAEGVNEGDLTFDEVSWLEEVSELIYAQYAIPAANMNGALAESYLDIGSFGTCVLYQEWNVEYSCVVFSAEPVAQCYFLEDRSGHVDTVYRVRPWTIRQCEQEFGPLPPDLRKLSENGAGKDKFVEVLHCVYPRNESHGGLLPTRMPTASLWICLTTNERLRESGYSTFPYHVARWTKLAGECYGRGPAKKCLPDVKMLNAMERTIIKAGQKIVDPPLQVSNEGWILPIKTSPGALIYKEDEDRQIVPLETKGNLPWAEDKAEQKRNFIRKCFYNDWIRRQKKTREQSATEINDDRDEMLTLFAPILGRLSTEMHGPMIARTYHLLNERALLPEAPRLMTGRKLRVGYRSQAARAQSGSLANQIARYIQDLVPLAQLDPGVMDAVDFDAAARTLAVARGTPRSILRSPEDLAAFRQKKEQAQQAQQMAAIAEPASNAIKNLAQAKQAAGGVI